MIADFADRCTDASVVVAELYRPLAAANAPLQ